MKRIGDKEQNKAYSRCLAGMIRLRLNGRFNSVTKDGPWWTLLYGRLRHRIQHEIVSEVRTRLRDN